MRALVIFKRLTKKCKQRPDHDYTSVDLLVLCLLERFYECIYSNKTTTKKKTCTINKGRRSLIRVVHESNQWKMCAHYIKFKILLMVQLVSITVAHAVAILVK
jgi:hypothetical protein